MHAINSNLSRPHLIKFHSAAVHYINTTNHIVKMQHRSLAPSPPPPPLSLNLSPRLHLSISHSESNTSVAQKAILFLYLVCSSSNKVSISDHNK